MTQNTERILLVGWDSDIFKKKNFKISKKKGVPIVLHSGPNHLKSPTVY